jgi:hypothetical protein
MEDRSMKPYIVTVYQAGKRTRYPAIAASWYDCWLTAVNEFGMRIVVSVRPA